MQVQSISPSVPLQIECDGYVPLVIRMHGDASWPPQYWRTGDFKKSLVEIAIDPSTGTICKIVVTSICDVSTASHLTNVANMQPRSGVPNAKLTIWDSDQTRVDVKGVVRGSLEGRTFTVTFGDYQEINSVVNCDRVNFLLNSTDDLFGFQVIELTEQEVEDLRCAIGLNAGETSGT